MNKNIFKSMRDNMKPDDYVKAELYEKLGNGGSSRPAGSAPRFMKWVPLTAAACLIVTAAVLIYPLISHNDGFDIEYDAPDILSDTEESAAGDDGFVVPKEEPAIEDDDDDVPGDPDAPPVTTASPPYETTTPPGDGAPESTTTPPVTTTVPAQSEPPVTTTPPVVGEPLITTTTTLLYAPPFTTTPPVNVTSSISPSYPTLSESGADFITIKGNRYSTDLTELHLNHQGLTCADIEPLKYMTNLFVLGLMANNIKDLSPLSGLENLVYLDIRDMSLTSDDLIPIGGLTNIRTLLLEGNKITDLSVISGLVNMDTLYMSSSNWLIDSGLRDLTPLSNMRQLRELQLCGHGLTSADLEPLRGLTSMENLSIRNNRITDLSALSGMTRMKTLNIGSNRITDISPLTGMTRMEWLHAQNNGITDISALSEMRNLEYLYLDTLDLWNSFNNKVTCVEPLRNLTKLRHLWLTGNMVEDISPLANLTNLTELFLPFNQISDISVVSGLANLEWLSFEGNINVTDVSPIRNLTGLKHLGLGGTSPQNLYELEGLTNLRTFDLQYAERVDRQQLAELQAALPNCEFWLTGIMFS